MHKKHKNKIKKGPYMFKKNSSTIVVNKTEKAKKLGDLPVWGPLA